MSLCGKIAYFRGVKFIKYKMMKKIILVLVALVQSYSLFSQTKLPTIFGNDMILQQKTKVAIWGTDTPNTSITVTGDWGAKSTVKSDKKGNWKLFLETVEAGGPFVVKVKGSDEIVFKNVLLGEVWLCMGQSNMGWSVGNTFEGEKDSKEGANPNLRIYKSDRQNWHEPKLDCPSGAWNEATPKSVAETSAVSYYFAERLQKELGIPVGIIVQAYAGTPIEGWMPWEIQKNNKRSIKMKKEWDAVAKRQVEELGFTEEKALKKYEKELKDYQGKMANGDVMKNKIKKRTMPIIVKPANLGNQYPSNIYNAMAHPIIGYGIKGMIWYQGERNSKSVQQALDLKGQLKMMIDFYRGAFSEKSNGNVSDQFYFSMTQLPSWNPTQVKPVEGVEASWAVSRNSMREVVLEHPNTAMSVSIDTGDSIGLHPKNKKPIGIRHAFNVLHDVYGSSLVAHGPYYKNHKIDGKKIVLEFTGVGSGLVSAKKGVLNAFAIAGKDQKWHWADAVIEGDKVEVSSKEVEEPIAVRYAWAMNPSQRNLLYNKEGLPASPFRTDNWRLFEEGSEEVQVHKPKKIKGHETTDWDRPEMQ